MLIGTFETIPLRNTEGEEGQIVSELEIETSVLNAHRSPKEYLLFRIAQHLAGVCARTNTPKEIWSFLPSLRVRQLTELPERIPFG